MSSSWLEVDLAAITANARAICRKAGADVKLFAVVKANGFGHGAVPAARAAVQGGAEAVAVAYLDEALALRAGGLTSPVIVLTPPDRDGVRAAQNQRVEVVVGAPEQAADFGEVASRTHVALRVHAKLDTGLGRHGTLTGRAPELLDAIAGEAALRLVGVCTHNANAADPAATREQLAAFVGATASLPPGVTRHFASSAAMASTPDSCLDAVRVGAFLYGLHLGLPPDWLPDIRPAMNWRAPVVFAKRLPPGHPVSYGSLFRAQRETLMGIVPVGYAHGYPHHLSNNSAVLVRGRRAPVIGAVCMDMLCVDLTDVPGATLGDVVTLLGADGDERIEAEELAERAGTIPYEIITGLPERVRRVYLGEGAE